MMTEQPSPPLARGKREPLEDPELPGESLLPPDVRYGIRVGLWSGGLAAAATFACCYWVSTWPAMTDTSLTRAFRPWWRLSNFALALAAFAFFGLVMGVLAAFHAFRRLFADSCTDERLEILLGLGDRRNGWAVPILIERARDGTVIEERGMALVLCDFITGMRFCPTKAEKKEIDAGYNKYARWWNAEGNIRYGPGGAKYWPSER